MSKVLFSRIVRFGRWLDRFAARIPQRKAARKMFDFLNTLRRHLSHASEAIDSAQHFRVERTGEV